MLSVPLAIGAVAAGLDRWKQTNVVLDPVMVATSGDRLLAPEAIARARRDLFPRALVITPNLHEAAALTDAPLARNEDEMRAQAQALLALGANAVLIKGGHAQAPRRDRPAGRRATRSRALHARRRSTPTTRTAPAARSPPRSRPASRRARRSRGGRATRRPTSPPRSPPPTSSPSATATARCIIFTPGGRRRRMTKLTRRTLVRRSARSRNPRRRPPSRARRRNAGAWSPPGRSACPGPACRPSASPSGSRRSPAAACRSPCTPRASSRPPSRCSTRSAAASPRWATPPRSTGRASSRPRPTSPPCRSG